MNLRDLENIEPGSPEWRSINAWAQMQLKRLRDQRETEAQDIRKLDTALGGIIMLKALLELPTNIKTERQRRSIPDNSFDIPPI